MAAKSEQRDWQAILDIVMPGMNGIDVLREIKKSHPTIEVIMASGCGTLQTAVEAMRLGAYDYVSKPILNFDEDLLKVVNNRGPSGFCFEVTDKPDRHARWGRLTVAGNGDISKRIREVLRAVMGVGEGAVGVQDKAARETRARADRDRQGIVR